MATKKPAKILPSLKAMAEDKEDDTIGKSVTTFLVDPRTITIVPGHNGRPISRERVESFKIAMLDYAVFPALDIRVVDGRRELVDGEHRLTAYLELIAEKKMAIEKVLCLELKNANDADVIEHMIAKNDGFGLTPLQLGIKYKELLALGRTNAKIAARFGKSVQHVTDCLRLAGADVSVQDAITRGEIKSTAALNVIKKEGSKAGKVIAAAVTKAKESGKAKVTAKNLGNSYVEETKARAEATKKHLLLMFDAMGAEAETERAAINTVLKVMKVPAPPADQTSPLTIVRDWLSHNATSDTPRIKDAAQLLYAAACGEALPEATPLRPLVVDVVTVSLAQQLQIYGAHPDAAIRQAASVLYKAAASDTMPASLVEAIATEMGSDGMVMAETLCPEHAELIAYLRSTGAA